MEWTKVKDDTPRNVGAYPVVISGKILISAMYWNMEYWFSSGHKEEKVTHWLDLKPPKE